MSALLEIRDLRTFFDGDGGTCAGVVFAGVSGERECDALLAAYTYDEKGRLTGHADATKAEARYVYDAQDRLIRETDRTGYTFHFQFDDADRTLDPHVLDPRQPPTRLQAARQRRRDGCDLLEARLPLEQVERGVGGRARLVRSG